MWIEETTCISDIQTLLSGGYEVEVDSPDGWVSVRAFVDKGLWEEYILRTQYHEVRCNENHLFKCEQGWFKAKEMCNNQTWVVHTDEGPLKATVEKTCNTIPIVDIQVEHKNHRYYTNGVESHNTNVGKSLTMCSFAADNLRDRKNVLYITLELSETEVAKRIDANLLDVDIGEVDRVGKQEFAAKIKRLQQQKLGKLIVHEYPTTSAGAANFRYLLRELELKKKFKPDIIYIDYLNICCSSRLKAAAAVNSYNYIKAIAEELRGLAVEFQVPIWTATQVNREGFTNSDFGMEHQSESFGLPATADMMLALISTEELAEQGKFMVKQLKSRYGDPNTMKRFLVGVDKTRMRVYDIENPLAGITPSMTGVTDDDEEPPKMRMFEEIR